MLVYMNRWLLVIPALSYCDIEYSTIQLSFRNLFGFTLKTPEGRISMNVTFYLNCKVKLELSRVLSKVEMENDLESSLETEFILF